MPVGGSAELVGAASAPPRARRPGPVDLRHEATGCGCRRDSGRARELLGLVGTITALEVTDGVNGWHPHRHVMLLTDRPMSRDQVDAFEAVLDDLYGRWLAKQGRKTGGVDPITGRRVGVRLEYVAPGNADQLGRYITKLQAGFELTRGDLKTSRHAKGRLPLDLLDEAM